MFYDIINSTVLSILFDFKFSLYCNCVMYTEMLLPIPIALPHLYVLPQ